MKKFIYLKKTEKNEFSTFEILGFFVRQPEI